MTSFRTFLACTALITPIAGAQDIAPKESERDPMMSALTEGFGDDEGPSRLDFSAASPSLVPEQDGTPVLVTGKPPIEFEEAPEPEPEGVSVNVEPGKDGHAKIAAASVKLLAPFAAKPLFQPPAGWRLEHPEEVPTFIRKVPLANGTTISLAIRPHLLVPDADGENVLTVSEPGYDPDLGFAQSGTMGAVLSASVQRAEEDSRRMSEALDRLSQLLASLPAAPEASPVPEPSPTTKKQR